MINNKIGDKIALNYDQWQICSSACKNGKKLKISIYEFTGKALKRKFGKKVNVINKDILDCYDEFKFSRPKVAFDDGFILIMISRVSPLPTSIPL